MSDEFSGWYLVGRGRTFSFYATDEEVAEWLVEMLPDSFGPYTILGREWQENRWQAFEHPLDEIRESFVRHRSFNHWIRSDVLSPGLAMSEPVELDDEGRLSFSGLIQVCLGGKREDGRQWESHLGIVARIRHETTGEEIHQPDYLRIFERLRRSMRKRLVVETMYTQPDGTAYPHEPMTRLAAEAHRRGEVVFLAEPIGI